MRNILFLLVFLITQTGFGQGLIFDSENYNRMPIAPMGDNTKSLTSKIPGKWSLVEYVPPPIDQRPLNICVPVTTLYYATGIRLAKKYGDSRKEEIQKKYAAAPMYNFMLNNLPCNIEGVDFTSMMYDLQKNGGITFDRLRDLKCPAIVPNSNYEIKAIKNSEYRFCGPADNYGNPRVECNSPSLFQSIRKYISDGYPVVIGLQDISGLEKVNSRRNIYIPEKELANTQHAVTIVGYDHDEFTMVNSWGPNVGGNENGLFRMLEEDLSRLLVGAFVFDVELVGNAQNLATNKDNLTQSELGISMDFNKLLRSTYDEEDNRLTNTESQPVNYLGNGHYTLQKSDYTQSDRFQIEVKNLNANVYMAVLSMDANTRKVVRHWSSGNNVFGSTPRDVPLPVSGLSQIIPSKDDSFYIEDGSKDYVIVLLSHEPLDDKINGIMNRLENYQDHNAPIHSQLYFALGTDMISPNQAGYQSNAMQVTTQNGGGSKILPLIMEMNHN